MDDCDIIGAKLSAALQPAHLKVTNFSDQHAGHAGSPNSGRSHFRIDIRSDTLNAMTRVKAHQAIYQILTAEMSAHIHALEITLRK